MRETRLSGSEGGGVGRELALPTPIPGTVQGKVIVDDRRGSSFAPRKGALQVPKTFVLGRGWPGPSFAPLRRRSPTVKTF